MDNGRLKLKIVSDGTREGTHVMVDGGEIKDVYGIQLFGSVDGPVVCGEMTFVSPEVEVTLDDMIVTDSQGKRYRMVTEEVFDKIVQPALTAKDKQE